MDEGTPGRKRMQQLESEIMVGRDVRDRKKSNLSVSYTKKQIWGEL